MLIRNADIFGYGPGDLRIAGGRIAAIGVLPPLAGETVLEAGGGALLPGLHDHHLHLAGLAARAGSILCGPPEVDGADALGQRLRGDPGSGWLRGIGYHESVMGLPDAAALDKLLPGRPLRIQHRSGRMWLLNSMALTILLDRAAPPPGLERGDSGFTGRLFDEDGWLRTALASSPPDFGCVSAQLACHGITGITDMSPGNDAVMAQHFAGQLAAGRLMQRCWLAGTASLADASRAGWQLGPVKLHLHEAALPGFDAATALIAAAHHTGRTAAVHCVSEVELVFALAAFAAAGTVCGDRIEHASVASDALVAQMAALGLQACVQPHFVRERGDRYLAEVEPRHHGELYRLRALREAGLVLAGGSDAPFGSADPWAAMDAAVRRHTASLVPFTPDEALSPEQALALFLADPADLRRQRSIAPGEPADLCLLQQPWASARAALASVRVRATIIAGVVVHDGVDQPPAQRMGG